MGDIQNLMNQVNHLEDHNATSKKKSEEFRDMWIDVRNERDELKAENKRMLAFLDAIFKLIGPDEKGRLCSLGTVTHFKKLLTRHLSYDVNKEIMKFLYSVHLQREVLWKQVGDLQAQHAEDEKRVNKAEKALLAEEFEALKRERAYRPGLLRARNLEAKVEVLEGKLKRFENFEQYLQQSAQSGTSEGDDVSEFLMQVMGKFKKLETKLESILDERRPLEDKIEDLTADYEDRIKKLKNDLYNKREDGQNFIIEYINRHFDEPLHLHKEIAALKKQLGMPDHCEYAGNPPNKIVHERRMLAYAMAFGDYAWDTLPEECREPDFWKGLDRATIIAIYHFAPGMAYIHDRLGKTWIPPTVAILCERGLVGEDAEETMNRINSMWAEMQQVNEADPGYAEDEVY